MGRPPLTGRTEIVGEARKLGFARMTVGEVTRTVGVKYSTFYRHFPSLESLVETVVEELIDEIPPIPSTGSWQELIRSRAATLYEAFDQTPGLVRAMFGLPSANERLTALQAPLEPVLVGAGFTAKEAAAAASTITKLAWTPFVTVTVPPRALDHLVCELDLLIGGLDAQRLR